MSHNHDHNHDHEVITLVDEQGNETLFEILLTIDGREEFGKNYVLLVPAGAEEDVDGETYHFITEEQFNDMIEKDLFAEHASYNGWQYGTAKEDCTDDKVVVLTPHGLRQLKKNKDLHIISFYIDVPRRDRLIKILERGDDIEEAYRRNLSDVGQFDGIKDEVDYVISNKGYSWSPLNMAHIIKRSMEWMKC